MGVGSTNSSTDEVRLGTILATTGGSMLEFFPRMLWLILVTKRPDLSTSKLKYVSITVVSITAVVGSLFLRTTRIARADITPHHSHVKRTVSAQRALDSSASHSVCMRPWLAPCSVVEESG